MAQFAINCPACGNIFEYSEMLETVFCSCCGRKLRLKWKVESVLLDEQSSSQTYSSSSQDTVPSDGVCVITIHMPTTCIPLKGDFSNFAVKWDGKEVSISQKGEKVELRTLHGTHHLTLVQVNSKMVGTETKEESFQVPVKGNRTIIATATEVGFEVE